MKHQNYLQTELELAPDKNGAKNDCAACPFWNHFWDLQMFRSWWWSHVYNQHVHLIYYWSLSMFLFVCQNLTGDGSVRLLVLPIIHTNTLEVLSALITAWVLTCVTCAHTLTQCLFFWVHGHKVIIIRNSWIIPKIPANTCHNSLNIVLMAAWCWHRVCYSVRGGMVQYAAVLQRLFSQTLSAWTPLPEASLGQQRAYR